MTLIPCGTAGETAAAPRASLGYIRELDGLRAVAVLIVVCAHYRLLPAIPGGFGVTLFFFLSGYLITTLFQAEYASDGKISVSRFYLRRWLRLTPSLGILVLCGIVFAPLTRHAAGGTPVPAGTIAAALLYYTNYYDLAWAMDPVQVVPFGICWSLAVEEHFYLVWPWIIRKALPNPGRLAMGVAALCATILLWRVTARFALGFSQDHTAFATDCRVDSILYGALLRLLFEARNAGRPVRILRARVTQLGAVIVLVLSFSIRSDVFRETLRYTLQGIALMPVFTAVLTGDPHGLVRRVLSSRPMVLVGQMSYSIYLFHLLASSPGKIYFGSPFGVGATVSGLVLTGLVSYALLIAVDRPIALLRHRLRRGYGVPERAKEGLLFREKQAKSFFERRRGSVLKSPRQPQ